MKFVIFPVFIIGALAAPVSAQATSDHVFFPAITQGNVDGARAMIVGNVGVADWEQARLKRKSFTPTEFFERVKPCYFRVAFAKTEDKNLEVGVWMCALTPTKADPNLSRTILVQARYAGETVSLDSYMEQESMKPAPAPASNSTGQARRSGRKLASLRPSLAMSSG